MRFLTCKNVYFYSMIDEQMFFDWIKKIPCIQGIECARDEVYLDLVGRDLEYEDIKDLIALLYRYQIDMKQLQSFYNESNKSAFMPWNQEIFGKAL